MTKYVKNWAQKNRIQVKTNPRDPKNLLEEQQPAFKSVWF